MREKWGERGAEGKWQERRKIEKMRGNVRETTGSAPSFFLCLENWFFIKWLFLDCNLILLFYGFKTNILDYFTTIFIIWMMAKEFPFDRILNIYCPTLIVAKYFSIKRNCCVIVIIYVFLIYKFISLTLNKITNKYELNNFHF